MTTCIHIFAHMLLYVPIYLHICCCMYLLQVNMYISTDTGKPANKQMDISTCTHNNMWTFVHSLILSLIWECAPYLYRSFSAKEPYNSWLFCEKSYQRMSYEYTYAHMYICRHRQTDRQTDTHTHTYIPRRTNTRALTHTRTHTHAHTHTHTHTDFHLHNTTENLDLKRFEQIELPAQRLDDFLSNKSNVNLCCFRGKSCYRVA